MTPSVSQQVDLDRNKMSRGGKPSPPNDSVCVFAVNFRSWLPNSMARFCFLRFRKPAFSGATQGRKIVNSLFTMPCLLTVRSVRSLTALISAATNSASVLRISPVKPATCAKEFTTNSSAQKWESVSRNAKNAFLDSIQISQFPIMEIR